MGRCGVLIVPLVGALILGACAGLPPDTRSEATVDSLRIPAPVPTPVVVDLPLPEPPVLEERPELHQIHRPDVSEVPSVLPEPRVVSKGLLSARSAAQQVDRWGGPLVGWTEEPGHLSPHSEPQIGETPAEARSSPVPAAPTVRRDTTAPAVAGVKPTTTPTSSSARTPAVRPVKPVPAVAGNSQPAATGAGLETTVEDVFVKSGDDIQISLAGNGWILLEPPEAGVAEFRSREQLAGRTVFNFRGVAPGKTPLEFIRQNNAEGVNEQQRFRLGVLSEQELNARFSGAQTPELDTVDRSRIDGLLSLGRYEEARTELEKTYRPESAFHNERLARISQALGQADEARTYWSRNLPSEGSPSTAYGESALVGIMSLALQNADLGLVLSTLPGVMAIRDLDTSKILLESASYLLEHDQAGAALEALEVHQRRYPQSREADRFFFILARVFEANSEIRDLKRSRDYYETVYTGYPESPLADSARRKARYLDRHFLKIQ